METILYMEKFKHENRVAENWRLEYGNIKAAAYESLVRYAMEMLLLPKICRRV